MITRSSFNQHVWFKTFRRVLIPLTLLIAGIPAQAQDNSLLEEFNVPRGEEAIPLLNEIWKFGKENIYPADRAARFTDEALAGLEAMLRSGDQVTLAEVLNPFLGSLDVSHTHFYDRRYQSYYLLRSLFATRNLDEPKLYTIGVQLNDDRPGTIKAVLDGSPAADAGIHRGDVITAVNGQTFESLLQWQSSEAVRLRIRSGESVSDVVVEPVYESYHRALTQAIEASRHTFQCGDTRIGYLHLWTGTHGVALQTLKETVGNARDEHLDGFILDLRDGAGGSWWPYLDPFFPDRGDYFTAEGYTNKGRSNPLHAPSQTNADAWDGPLAVLINGWTRSGKEALAYQFRKSGRAALFGTTTTGALTGGMGVFADRDADYILYLAVQENRLDGIRIEGAGVSPDVEIEDGRDEDPPLAAALNHLGCAA